MARPFGTLPTRFEPSSDAIGVAFVLPGSNYSPSAPARTVWVGDRAAAAIGAEAVVPERILLVGKSLGTLATPYAAAMGHAAIWLTPLLNDQECVAGIRANPGRQLLVGGLADPFWNPDVAAGLRESGCEVLEIPDANHSLWVDDDAVRSAEIQLEIADATERFLASL
jgi:pimeloyl-ACP methyl ester carboxylesterase